MSSYSKIMCFLSCIGQNVIQKLEALGMKNNSIKLVKYFLTENNLSRFKGLNLANY